MAAGRKRGMEGFIQTAEQGDVATLGQMLDRGIDVNCRRGDGWTALMAAAAHGKAEAFELLLSRGADPHLTDSAGNTALHHAASAGKEPMVRALLERGLDINAPTRAGYTPLILAALDERVRAVRCLLQAGADVNAQSMNPESLTALKAARGNDKITALLLASGARLDPRKDEIVAKALARVAAARAKGQPPEFRQQARDAFVQAASLGEIEVVRELLAAGMPVDARDQRGQTAVQLCAGNGQAIVFQALLDAGADSKAGSPSAWPMLVLAAHGGNADIVRLLLQRGLDPDESAADGITPLMAAALKGDATVVRILLQAGADPHRRGGWARPPGKTALEWAQANRKAEVIPLLADAMGLAPETVAPDPAYAAARRFRETAGTAEFLAVLQRLTEECGRAPVPWEKRKGVFRCYLRESTTDRLQGLQGEIRAAGFQLVLYELSPGFANAAKLMVFPTAEKFAVLVARGTNGINYGLDTRSIIAWLRNLDKDNPFDLTACGFDFLEGEFRGPVKNAEAWAERMLEFCPDCGSAEEILAGLSKGSSDFGGIELIESGLALASSVQPVNSPVKRLSCGGRGAPAAGGRRLRRWRRHWHPWASPNGRTE